MAAALPFVLAKFLGNLKPVHFRHVYVQQQQVELFAQHGRERFAAILAICTWCPRRTSSVASKLGVEFIVLCH